MKKITFTYVNLSIWIWIKVILCIAICAATTSTLFLYILNYITDTREKNLWLLFFLPLGGVAIVYIYKKYGSIAKKGNNLLLEEYYLPQGKIPWMMAPLIIMATFITHLFGGSAGREGTALQYGGTYGDRIAAFFQLDKSQNRIALMAGVAAGFGSLFETPFAGAIFALEVFKLGRIRAKALPIVVITAYTSHIVAHILQAPHTKYTPIESLAYFDLTNLWIIPVAIACGFTARLFIVSGKLWGKLFGRIANEYYRVTVGALLLLLMIYLSGTTKYIGLGIPSILSAFEVPAVGYDFLLKIIFTTLTLSIGFKGGEVTPLFFIGATLTSFLSLYVPLPLVVMAGLGFVGVFAGSTKTPLACALMTVELFGPALFPLALITCIIATMVSGKQGIYSSQRNLNNWF